MTELRDAGVFKLVKEDKVPFKESKNLLQGIFINIDMDLLIIQRSGYTFLDILSDVGGIQGILISAISILMAVHNYYYLDSYIISKLFKVGSGPNQVNFSPIVYGNMIDYCIDQILPSKLVCCRREKKQLAMNKARETLDKEVDIIEMIKSRRFFNMALRHILLPELYKELHEKS